MRRACLVLAALIAVLLPASGPASADGFPVPLPTAPEGDAPGSNDWTCAPTRERPVPVVMVHGTFGDRRHLLEPLVAALAADGFCVYSLDYGNRATGDIARSARTLARFVDKVRAATGARRVSLVGHSQGGMMPRYFIKNLGGASVVEDLVGIAPSNHGTSIVFSPDDPLLGDGLGLLCRACQQQGAGHPFLTELNTPDETPGPVSYTQITTRYDEVVVPHTSGYLAPGPRTTNLTLQDACPNDFSEHLLIPVSPTTISWTLHALTREGPADPAFQPAC